MAIADYLSGINRATTGQTADVASATKDLAGLQAGAGSLPTKLKEALNTKLNSNQDIISQQADTMGAYFNAAPQARVKYADVFDPFKKAALVQGERTAALRPYDVLSGVLENRMGSVNDIVQSGIQGWQGLVNAAGTKADLAKSNLAQALQSYLAAAGQQSGADTQAMESARMAEQARQFGVSSGMEQQRITNQASQFASDQALQLKLAGMKAGGGSKADLTATALLEAQKYGLDPTTGKVNPDRMWEYINMNQDTMRASGINVQTLWDAQNLAKYGQRTPPVVKPVVTAPKTNLLSNYWNTGVNALTNANAGQGYTTPSTDLWNTLFGKK